ncbi:MAG: TonB-dependent receptor, partial [Gammaproteobacteria bacterium]
TIYDIADNQHIKFIYSEGEKAPSPSNNISIIDLSLAPLNPEKSRTLELSYIMATPRYFLQVGVFHNRVSDLIITSAVLDGGSFVDALSNHGELDVLGLELTTTAQITNTVKLNFDISLHDVKDTTPGYENIEPAYAPLALANLRATYSFNQDTHISLLGHYVSSVLAEWKLGGTAGDPIQQRIDTGSRSGDEIDGYASFDANLVMQNLFAPNLDISIKLGNITDQYIRYPTINNQAFDKGTLGLDRHLLLTAQYQF